MIVVELKVVVVPLTVRLPAMTASVETYKLAALTLPVVLTTPMTYAPVVATVITLAVPAVLIDTLPLLVTDTFDVPL